jgi:vacuolar-type H+-ATPase subunit F/Vma7
MKIIAMGSAELMDGFALLGIETHADATADGIDALLTGLVRGREQALIFIQQDLMRANIPMIRQLRIQGSSILICEIPNLQATDDYRPEVEKLIARVLGPSVLENQLDQ